MEAEKKPTFIKKLKAWAKRLKQELKALDIALTENLVPWYVKVLIIITLGYALSPIDLIPDFIPILGLLDDLIIIPLLISLITRLVPKEVMAYCREQAEIRKISLKKNWRFALVIVVIWTILAYHIYKLITN